MDKKILREKVLWGIAREQDFEALGLDEVRAIKSDGDVMHHRFVERAVKDAGDRTFEHYASTEHVDSMGDIIRVAGWDLIRLKVGRVPLFLNHSEYPAPMGLVHRGRKDKDEDGTKALVTTSRVHEQELYADSEFGKVVEIHVKLMQRGDLTGGSVGFAPKSWSFPDEDERKKLGMGRYGQIYDEQELLEFSITPIPANSRVRLKKNLDRLRESLTGLVKAGETRPEDAEALYKALTQAEEEWMAREAAKKPTVVALGIEAPWVRGGKGGAAAASPEPLASLRAIVREEVGASVSRSLTEVARPLMLDLASRIDHAVERLDRAASERGENGTTKGSPAPQAGPGSTGTSREADPVAFQRAQEMALLAGMTHDLRKDSSRGNRNRSGNAGGPGGDSQVAPG